MKNVNDLIVRDFNGRIANWWNDIEKEFDLLISNNGKRINQSTYPKVDVSEDERCLQIEASVPGILKEALSIEYSQGVLSISGESEKRIEGLSYHRQELHRSKFSRSFSIPENLFDIQKISAKIDSGILKIMIPKLVELKPENNSIKIEIF